MSGTSRDRRFDTVAQLIEDDGGGGGGGGGTGNVTEEAYDSLSLEEKRRVLSARGSGESMTPDGTTGYVVSTIVYIVAVAIYTKLVAIWPVDAVFLATSGVAAVAWYCAAQLIDSVVVKHPNVRWVSMSRGFTAFVSLGLLYIFVTYAFNMWTLMLFSANFAPPQSAVVFVASIVLLLYFVEAFRDTYRIADKERHIAHLWKVQPLRIAKALGHVGRNQNGV